MNDASRDISGQEIDSSRLVKDAEEAGVPIDLIAALTKGLSAESYNIVVRNISDLDPALKDACDAQLNYSF